MHEELLGNQNVFLVTNRLEVKHYLYLPEFLNNHTVKGFSRGGGGRGEIFRNFYSKTIDIVRLELHFTGKFRKGGKERNWRDLLPGHSKK